MQKVAVIIVNFNGKKYLSKLLESIFNHPPQNVQQEIIIIDNNSGDGSPDWLKQNYPQIELLEEKQNLGFAGANNLGFKRAIELGCNYAMLLNQDTIVTAGYLDKLVAKISAEQNIGAIQPRIMLYPETELVNSLGNVIHYLGLGYTYGHKTPFNKLKNRPQKTDYCSGAACLYNLSALKKVGFFDDYFFMYHEDLDLGWRLSLAGYRNDVLSDAIVYHQYEFSRSIKKFYYMERNRFLTIFANYRPGTILLILPALILMELGLFVFSFKNGWWREKLKVYGFLLKPSSWQKIKQRRKEINKIRNRSDRSVVKSFSGEIKHQEIENPIVNYLVNPLFNLYWQLIKHLILW